MPLTVTMEDCRCQAGNHTDLEEISVILRCVECGALVMAFSAPLDGVINMLEELRRRRVYGTSVQHSDGHREVIGIRRPEAEAG